jgi:hypothetical protein
MKYNTIISLYLVKLIQVRFFEVVVYLTVHWNPLTIQKILGFMSSEFNVRFQDFKLCEGKYATFTLPFYSIKNAHEYLQIELNEMQCNSILKLKFHVVSMPNCYSDWFPIIIQFSRQIYAVFDSTYMCKQLFSLMTRNKTSERSGLTDMQLSSVMKSIAGSRVETKHL